MFSTAQIHEQIAPPMNVAAITPSDTTRYDPPLRALSVDLEGAVAVLLDGMTDPVTLPAGILRAGGPHPMLVRQVMSTGTNPLVQIWGWR